MIGYYVHHQGRGHLTRALGILAAHGGPATVLSSVPRPTDGSSSGVDWVDLRRDDETPRPRDPTAGGVLHWVPRHDPGLRDRMAAIASWIARTAPRLVVVDVSVEVALLCRLLGVPVLVVAMPGDRTDRAHRSAYDVADALLACWPREVLDPPWPSAWTAKTRFVGALSRYDDRIGTPAGPAAATPDDVGHRPARTRRRRVVVLLGAGGRDVGDDDLAAAARATPDWTWTVLGGGDGWVPDPWPLLRGADVIVTHAGQNALAEVAASRRPAIVVPQRRPHGEQFAASSAIAAAGLATVCPRWPDPAVWATLLADATADDGDRWRLWCPGGAAAGAAGLIRELTGEVSPCTSG
ncbi:glycosyltransferase [Pseudonocardia sp.]|uniref:glycosyltransferase n=1 Tax=Pseudonocardia sp. TaxID=60912 RepID=UPI003D0DD3E7